MNEVLEKNLRAGERVLWTGKPEKVSALDAPYRTPILIRWLVAAVLMLCGICYLCFYHGPVEERVKVIVFLLLAAAAIYLFVDPLIVAKKISGGTLYCVTDQRAIAIFKGIPAKVKVRELKDIKDFETEQVTDGYSVLYIGEHNKDNLKRARYQKSFTDAEDEVESTPLMFYAISAKAADTLLGALRKGVASSAT